MLRGAGLYGDRYRSPDNRNPMPQPFNLRILKTTVSKWNKHNATLLAASLAFYALVSLAPLTLIIIPISTLMFGRAEVEMAVVRYANRAAGPAMGNAVEQLVGRRRKQSAGMASAVLTFGTLLFAASAVFRELRSALNIIYEVEPKKYTLRRVVKQYLFAMVIVLAIGIVILASLVFSAILAGLRETIPAGISVPGKGWELINFFATFLIMTVVIALIFRFVPDLVIISAGFDSLAGDPLGAFTLQNEHIAELTRFLVDRAEAWCGGRVVSALEGGYAPERLGVACVQHMLALE